jgi:hypothetical protein
LSKKKDFDKVIFTNLSCAKCIYQIIEKLFGVTTKHAKEFEKKLLYDYMPNEQELNWRNSIKNIKLQESILTE